MHGNYCNKQNQEKHHMLRMHSQTASSDGSELQNRPDSNMYKYDGQYAGPQDNDTYQLQTTNYNLTSDRSQLK